ncbi:MAG: acyl-CoA desaturase [Flavobacteriales bacterium]|nr:acyl-CoA desaturase [Flavobacteriales bacterium]
MMNNTIPTAQTVVRFSNREQQDFVSALRKRVDNYFKESNKSQNADTRMYVKTAVLVSTYILPFVAILAFAPSFWVMTGLWIIMGFAMAGIGMSVMHDANHGAYLRDAKGNKFIGRILNLLGGSVYNWNLQHNVLHHTYTNVSGKDNDIDNKLVLKFAPHGEVKPVHKHQWYLAFFFYGILTIYWALAKDHVQYIRYRKEGLNKMTKNESRLFLFKITFLKTAYMLVAIGLPMMVGYTFWQVFTGFLVMHFIAGMILSVVFQLAHVVESTDYPLPDEKGNMENSWAVHQLHTTADFARHNKFLSWYVGGLNFQVEHHLFPNICHVHYADLAPIVKETAAEFNYPYHEFNSFGQAFKSHIATLRKFGTPPLDDIMG